MAAGHHVWLVAHGPWYIQTILIVIVMFTYLNEYLMICRSRFRFQAEGGGRHLFRYLTRVHLRNR